MKLSKSVVGFIAGNLSGMAIAWGIFTLGNRQGTFGGEVFIPLLMGLLIYFGWDLGRGTGQKMAKAAYKKGFKKGFYIAGTHKSRNYLEG